jgi:hypothetical protein
MDTTDNLDIVFDEVVYDNNAQEVFKQLRALDNRRDKLASRWVWELIQNARGTVDSQRFLEIQVAFDGDYLAFRHNGAPFKDLEIAHLILHGSTKRDPRDIGKFGTGFITTHLISRRVWVRGSLIDGGTFDFELNREGKDADEILEGMNRSKEQFKASLSNSPLPTPDPYTTEYRYAHPFQLGNRVGLHYSPFGLISNERAPVLPSTCAMKFFFRRVESVKSG